MAPRRDKEQTGIDETTHWLTRKIRVLEGKVASGHEQVQLMAQQIETLSGIFLFVDVDTLAKISKVQHHYIGEPCALDIPEEANIQTEEDSDSSECMCAEQLERVFDTIPKPCSNIQNSATDALRREIDEIAFALRAEVAQMKLEIDTQTTKDTTMDIGLIVKAVNDNTNSKMDPFYKQVERMSGRLDRLDAKAESTIKRVEVLEASFGLLGTTDTETTKKKKRPDRA